MAKKRPPTFEERKSALQAANAPRKPVTNQVPVEAPQPQKPAAPAKPVRRTVVKRSATARPTARPSGGAMARPSRTPQNSRVKPAATPKGVDVKAELDSALKPWSARPDLPWGGSRSSVGDFRRDAQRLHDEMKGDTFADEALQIRAVRETLGVDESEAAMFVRHAREGRDFKNRLDRFDVIETTGREGLWESMLDASGNPIVGGNQGNLGDTDLFASVRGSRKGVDVQDIFSDRPESIRLGIRKFVPDGGKRVFEEASGSERVYDIFRRMRGKPDKLTETTTGLMRGQHLKPGKQKDFMVGGLYDRVTDSRGRPTPANPRVFRRGFAVNMDSLRGNLLDATKDDVERMLGPNAWDTDPRRFGIEVPVKELKALGDGDSTLTQLISPDVQADIRRRGGDFYGGIPINGQQARAGAKELAGNWKGAAGLSLLNGASREVGVKLGQGDYAGAATEAAGNYVAGAAIERGIKSAATSGIGRRITGAVARRIPAALARFGAGTAGSGGLLAPALAVATVVDVADGITEGVTGKGLVTHGREAGERAEATKQEARAAGASETDLRRAARRSQPIAVPTPVSEPVAVAPPAPTRSTGPSINPTGAKQIAGAWRRRRK